MISLPDESKLFEIEDEWNKCPSCWSWKYSLNDRICYECDYNLDHNLSIKTVEQKKINKILFNTCSCWMSMNNWSRMCKECYEKNKLHNNF